MPDDVVGDLCIALFFAMLIAFVMITAWAEVQERKKKKLAPFVDWDGVLEEIQGTLDEYDDSHVW